MKSFAGDFSTLWTLNNRPPIEHLTWDWWWWLVMIDDEDHPMVGKQLMVLWSTKENDLVHINDVEWKPKGRPGLMIKEPFKSMAWFVHGGSMVRLCMTKSLPKYAIWWSFLPTMRHGQARPRRRSGRSTAGRRLLDGYAARSLTILAQPGPFT